RPRRRPHQSDHRPARGRHTVTNHALTAPHNQLGEPATATPTETVTRLQEKASDNRGGANRERIRAHIASRFKNSRAMSLQLPQRRAFRDREAPRASRRSGRPVLWFVASAVVLVAAVMWATGRSSLS